VIGIDCERELSAGWSGLDTKASQQLTIKIKGANDNIANAIMPTLMYTVLHYDCILKLSTTGAEVFD
jgi:hypothetical protein